MEVYLGTKRDGTTVSIHEKDRRKHMAILGKSGVGKTTLMRNMVVADLVAGNGLTVVDPYGSLIEDLLDVIPRHRTNDVIYLNPADPSRILGLNVLESVDPSQRSLIVSSLISIMRNLWPLNWGPRTEYILEHAVYALLEQPEPVTLAALPKHARILEPQNLTWYEEPVPPQRTDETLKIRAAIKQPQRQTDGRTISTRMKFKTLRTA